MNRFRRPLILIVIVLFLIGGGIAIANSRNIKSNLASAVECADDCKVKLDEALEKCEQQPEASRETCRRVANLLNTKCLDKCSGGKGKP